MKVTQVDKRPYTNNKGYILEYHPDHPRSDKNGLVFAHIVAYENTHNISVPIGFVIHHINGIKTDNRPENLIMLSRGEHTALHNKKRTLSDSTKSKISAKAKARLTEPSNHPMYRELDIEAIEADVLSGIMVKDVCRKYGIDKTTYYRRVKGYKKPNERNRINRETL